MGALSKLFGSAGGSESASGYGAMSPAGQGAYNVFAQNLNRYLAPDTEAYRFTPQGVSGDEQQAFEMMRRGVTPESLGQDMSMLMNPFDQYVVGDINRAATDDYSILKQALSEAGQVGSNRQILGASDIEQNRQNQIGRFRQDQYNRALDTSLGRLADLRSGQAQDLMGIGGFMRNLDLQTKQAPINALMQMGQGLAMLPQSSMSRTRESDPGMLNRMSGFVRGAMTPPSGGGMSGGGGFSGGMQGAMMGGIGGLPIPF